MSRRSGSIGPGMLLWLLAEGGLTVEELSRGLRRESGLYGLSDGCSDDTREQVRAAREGHSATGANRDDDGPVSPPGAAPPVLVVRAREELSLALDAAAAMERSSSPGSPSGSAATSPPPEDDQSTSGCRAPDPGT